MVVHLHHSLDTSCCNRKHWLENLLALHLCNGSRHSRYVLYHLESYWLFLTSRTVVYLFFPETQGKTLEEIDYIFVKGDARAMMSRGHDFGNEFGNGKKDDMELKAAAIHLDNASGSS
jgi:hypothetical protein